MVTLRKLFRNIVGSLNPAGARKPGRGRARKVRLGLECLETRELMDAGLLGEFTNRISLDAAQGVLRIEGT